MQFLFFFLQIQSQEIDTIKLQRKEIYYRPNEALSKFTMATSVYSIRELITFSERTRANMS